MIHPESSARSGLDRTSSNVSVSSNAHLPAQPKKNLFSRMLAAFAKKFSKRPVVIGIRTNEGKKLSMEQAQLRRANSAASTRNYKENDKVFFPAHKLSQDSSDATGSSKERIEIFS